MASTRRWPSRVGRGALAGIVLSVVLMTGTDALGRSAAVPRLDAAWPPWSAQAHPAQHLVVCLLWAALLLGAAALTAGLLAVRAGWRPALRPLLCCGVLACVALLVTPPAGSTDVLDYAGYGEQVVVGQNPYTHTPEQLRVSGDPVGAYVPTSWQRTPSVYGPLATGAQWAAAELGDGSAARTVFWVKAMNAVAFLGVSLLLDRHTRTHGARVRSHLMWTANPLLLWHLLAGAHVDALATVAAVAAVLVRPGLLAGLLTGAAAAVKAPYLLVGVGVLWAARRSPRRLAGFAAGLVAVLGAGYAVAGARAASDLFVGTAHLATIDPWRPLAVALGVSPGAPVLKAASLAASVVLACLLLRGLPWSTEPSAETARPALAALLGWLLPAPYQHPWYDAPAYALSATLPASAFDLLLVVHTLAGSLAYVPGVVRPPAGSFPSDVLLLPGLRVLAIVVAATVLGYVALTLRRRRPSSTPR